MPGDASTRSYTRLHHPGAAPLILMDAPKTDESPPCGPDDILPIIGVEAIMAQDGVGSTGLMPVSLMIAGFLASWSLQTLMLSSAVLLGMTALLVRVGAGVEQASA